MSQEEKELILKNLQEKVNILISTHSRNLEQIEQLFKEKQLLSVKIDEKDDRIKELLKENENLKFGNAIVLSNTDELVEMRHEAKIKINRIVKEIDRCIALLNKLN